MSPLVGIFKDVHIKITTSQTEPAQGPHAALQPHEVPGCWCRTWEVEKMLPPKWGKGGTTHAGTKPRHLSIMSAPTGAQPHVPAKAPADAGSGQTAWVPRSQESLTSGLPWQ